MPPHLETVGTVSKVPRVLIVDDDEVVRVSLTANLELAGYRVSEARDGSEAIAVLGQEAFDLIISDLAMPLATGIEVLAALRKNKIDTPFILISGLLPEDLLARASADGLFALLDKSLATEQVLAVAARALALSTVLMVSDSSASAAPLAAALRDIGLRVEACTGSAAALEFVTQHAVDVCVLDFVNRPLEGLELCQALRRRASGLAIIAITERTVAAEAVAFFSAATACLPKPFGVLELLTGIVRVRSAPSMK